jgi:hypothetical protein
MTYGSAIAKRVISPLLASNFVNCLFCQDYSEALKNFNTMEEAFIARAYVISIFLKLILGVKSRISYRESHDYSVVVRQDLSKLLKILLAVRYETIRQLRSAGIARRFYRKRILRGFVLLTKQRS